jgi:serpin B
MKKFQNLSSILMIILVFILAFGLIGCDPNIENNHDKPLEIQASDLMRGINPHPVNTVALNDRFRGAVANFSLDLFSATLSENENSLISPISVLFALAMTANGADGNTLSQIEQVIGDGMLISELNAYLYSFARNLNSQPKEHLSISNSIWFKNWGFTPNRNFLQTNANYYGADAFAAPFDEQTVNDINLWISKATDGLIEEMLKYIPEEAVLYLINTILFDAEWAEIYDEKSVIRGQFTNNNNKIQTADFMHSKENLFIKGNNVTGFIKPYYDNNYSFVAILPDEDINIHDFVTTLSGEVFLDLIKNARLALVRAALPKFDYEYEVLMNDMLIAMGMEDAFCEDTANLSRMGSWIYGDLWISKVLHKANIAVDERGTKAGAATVVEVSGPTSVPHYEFVILDRPFVYAIIDNSTNLPLFIGTFLSIP